MSQKISQYFDYKLNGKDYKIRFKTPTIGQQISIGQSLAAYKAGFPVLDTTSEALAYAIATLNVVIVDKPADLDFENIDSSDWKVVTQMLNDYQNFAFFRTEAPVDNTQS